MLYSKANYPLWQGVNVTMIVLYYYACALLLLCCIAALLAEFEVLFWKNPPMQGPFRRLLVVQGLVAGYGACWNIISTISSCAICCDDSTLYCGFFNVSLNVFFLSFLFFPFFWPSLAPRSCIWSFGLLDVPFVEF